MRFLQSSKCLVGLVVDRIPQSWILCYLYNIWISFEIECFERGRRGIQLTRYAIFIVSSSSRWMCRDKGTSILPLDGLLGACSQKCCSLNRHSQLDICGRRYAVFLLLALVLLSMSSSCMIPPSKPVTDYVGPPNEATASKIERQVKELPEISEPRTITPLLPISKEGPLQVTLSDAIMLGLGNNYNFQIQKLNPAIQATLEEQERAVFDPVTRALVGYERERSSSTRVTKGMNLAAGISTFLPTGTTLDFELGNEQENNNLLFPDPNDEYRSYIDLAITQALLRGAGPTVNLATLRQAQLDTRASEYELRGFAQTMTAEIENTYWDYILAGQEVEVYEKSLDLGIRLANETRERIALGQLASTEIYFAEAEAATREQNLINARSRLQNTRLRLLQFINPPSNSLWDRTIVPKTPPNIVEYEIKDIQGHLKVAHRLRPDLNQARLSIQRGDLEVVKTKNGLLPKLDAFIVLGRSGYSRTFDRSISDFTSGNGGMDISAGLTFEFPVFNRKAKAQYERSKLELGQQKEALKNLAQLAEEDVLSAFVEIKRTKEQIRASTVTVKYQSEKLQAEIDRYRMGESTMYRVAQAERDLVMSQVSEVQSRIEYLKALTQLYLSEGSLLIRWGIKAPGVDPVEMNADRPTS